MICLIVPTGYAVLDARIRGISLPALVTIPFDPGSLYRVFMSRIINSFAERMERRIVYVTIDEPASVVMRELRSGESNIEILVNKNLVVFEDLFRALSGKEVDTKSLLSDIWDVLQFHVLPHVKTGDCVVIDSLTFFVLDLRPKDLVRVLFSLKSEIYEAGTMCIVTYLRNALPPEAARIINHLSDVIFELQLIEDRPTLYIPKLRECVEGVPLLAPYEITSSGIRISTARRV